MRRWGPFNRRRWAVLALLTLGLFLIRAQFWPLHLDLTERDFLAHDTCPACFGSNLCAAFYKDEIELTHATRYTFFSHWFNAKNVFHARFRDPPATAVVLKKLAHTAELVQLDRDICQAYGESPSCPAGRFLRFLTREYTRPGLPAAGTRPSLDFQPLARHAWTEILSCLRTQRLVDHLTVQARLHESATGLEQVLTLLMLNPEPLVFMAFRPEDGWPFPRYYGACGRVAVMQDAGRPLSAFYEADWHMRVLLARQLLDAALKFTRNDLQIGLYYTDWISDNLAVDPELHRVTFVDGESFILVDQAEIRRVAGPGWNVSHHSDGFGCPSRFCYSTADLCTHGESDHNLYGLCQGLLAPDALDEAMPQGLLHSIPEGVRRRHSLLPRLLAECARPSHPGGRFEAALGLQEVLAKM